MFIANIICFVLVSIGSINWFLVGAFNFNLVSFLFMDGSFLTRFIYILVGIASLFLIFSIFYNKGITVKPSNRNNSLNDAV